MKRQHSLSNPDSSNPPSPPSSEVKRPCEAPDDPPSEEFDPDLEIRGFLFTIEENADLPLAERHRLAQSAHEVARWVFGRFMESKSIFHSDSLEMLSSWLTAFELSTLWLVAVLALRVEGQSLDPHHADPILQVAESQARNMPPDLPNCCSLSLLLVNLMLSREDDTELGEIIGVVHSFQLVCSPLNLLINFTLGQTVYSDRMIDDGIPGLDEQLAYIRILSGSANARNAIVSVMSRLVNHAFHPFSLNVINPDGSYPLHQAMLAYLCGYQPSSFIISLIELGAYPYCYSQSQICCTPFELTPDTLNFQITGGFGRLHHVTSECERLGLMSRVPPLRTLSARRVSKANNSSLPFSIKEFVRWHQFDPLKMSQPLNEDEYVLQYLKDFHEGEKKRNMNFNSYRSQLLYDPAPTCDEYSFFVNAHHTPGGVLEIMLQQPWIEINN